MQEVGRSVQVGSGQVSGQNVVFGNRLLDGLPRKELARIAPFLTRTVLQRGGVFDIDDDALYFPVDALVCSAIDTTGTGRTSALSVIGRRGAIDVAATSFDPALAVQTGVLCPGTAWRIDRAAGKNLASLSLQQRLRRNERALFAAGAARLACNSEHNVDRRVARWLLFVADETGKPQAELTHQQFALMASIARPSVSLAFADLARRAIVEVHQGLVQILDRESLEREACACYYVIRDLHDRAAMDG